MVRWVLQPEQPGPNFVVVVVTQLLKDFQCALPDLPRGGQLVKSLVGVAKVGEDVRFVVAVAKFPVQQEGLGEAGCGLLVVTEMVVDVAEAVPRCRDAGWATDLLLQ